MLAAPFWEGQAHDCQTGGVTTVAISFDNSYLLSAAQDGTLYVHVSRQRLTPTFRLHVSYVLIFYFWNKTNTQMLSSS